MSNEHVGTRRGGTALIVFANPEPASFGASLRDQARETLEEQGLTVEISDLYAMGWNPVATAEDFPQRRFPERLWYDREQKHAVLNNALAPDVTEEVDKLKRADLVVTVFPLWWFSVPAILKGWVDRCFVKEVAYGGGRRYDEAGFVGKRAMHVITTNAWPTMVGPAGLLGDIDVILWHLNNGMFAYAGFDVLPPLVANAVAFISDEERQQIKGELAGRLKKWRETEPIPFHRVSEFGEDWRLRPDVEPRVIGQHR